LSVFYEFVYPLHTIPGFSALNVFRYITFRSAYAAITALIVCFVVGPPMIEWLRQVKLGQKVRAEGPQTHLSKAGTPTMGGILIVSSIVVPGLGETHLVRKLTRSSGMSSTRPTSLMAAFAAIVPNVAI